MLTKSQIKRNEKFIAALRSGKYKQGTGQLHSDDSFCCLGVACEIKRITSRDGHWDDNNNFVDDEICHGDPPRATWKWYGWESSDPEIRVAYKSRLFKKSAIAHNDLFCRTFAQIADGFERWLKERIKEAARK